MYNEELDNYVGWIYRITNLINGKIYIGQTIQGINKRWNNHTCNARKNKPNMAITKAMKKYGINNFKIEELVYAGHEKKEKLQELLNYLECFLIDCNHSLINENGYNISKGGQFSDYKEMKVDVYDINGVYIETLDSHQIAANKYNTYKGCIGDICNGKRFNLNMQYVFRNHDDQLDIYPYLDPDGISQKKLNYYKVYQFDLDGNFIQCYNNVSDVLNQTGIKITKKILDDPYKTVSGYWWSTQKQFNLDDSIIKKYNNNKIDVYDLNGRFLKTYKDVYQYTKEKNLRIDDARSIMSVCDGKNKTAYGYVFRHHGEPLDKYNYQDSYKIFGLKKINQYDKDNNYIKTYKNVEEIIKEFHLTHSQCIYKCCRHEWKTSHGYQWFFADDINQPDSSKILIEEVYYG